MQEKELGLQRPESIYFQTQHQCFVTFKTEVVDVISHHVFAYKMRRIKVVASEGCCEMQKELNSAMHSSALDE